MTLPRPLKCISRSVAKFLPDIIVICFNIYVYIIMDKSIGENREDQDQTAPQRQSDHGLHCLTVNLQFNERAERFVQI